VDIKDHWGTIRKLFMDAFWSSQHYAIATINEDGSPHITPIGSLVLLKGNRGFYCEEFPQTMTKNLARDQRVCVMAVNSGRWYWLKSLFRGRFATPPGVRLMGRVGEKRKATEEERALWLKRVRPLRWLKGHDLLWSDMRYIREIRFQTFEPLSTGVMTRGLWQ